MRFALISTVLLCAIFATGTTNAQPTPAAPNATSTHLGAARDTLQALMLDFGLLATVTTQAGAEMAPQLERQISQSNYFPHLSTAHQQAVLDYLTTLGPIMAEYVNRAAPAILDARAPQLAAAFSEPELSDIAVFVRSPEGRTFLTDMARQGVSDAAANRDSPAGLAPTPTQQAALERFEQSAGGRAFSSHNAAFLEVQQNVIVDTYAAITPDFRARMSRDMCGLMEGECPSQLRAAGRAQ